MPDSTEQLLQRVRAGDRAAVDTLFVTHRQRLRQMVALRMDDRLSSRFDPSDVVQEGLKVAYQRLPAYLRQPAVSFYPWLRQIVWNCLIDFQRRHVHSEKRSIEREQRWSISNSSVAYLAEQLRTSQIEPLERMVEAELRTKLRAAVEQLTESHREILLLRYVEQLGGAECAEVLGIAEKAANQRHLRAVRHLRQILEQ